MKKIVLILMAFLFLTGCSKVKNENYINDFIKKYEKLKSYSAEGKMQVINDEETYNYNLEVKYLKKDYYLVRMLNSGNDKEQIILKNTEGLYVITPSLNKSFKFDSNWPNNSSQSYIISSLIDDLKKDDECSVQSENENEIVIKSKVNYPNNGDLDYELLYIDKDLNLKKVEVYNKNNVVKISLELTKFDANSNISKEEFLLENFVKEKECEENCENNNDKNVIKEFESALYPLYMPANTFLNSSDIVSSELDKRAILTFSGEKNFVIVEQSASVNSNFEVIPIYGDPTMVNDTIGALTNNSISWTNNNIDYYLVSDDLSLNEMVTIASSIGNYSATMNTK